MPRLAFDIAFCAQLGKLQGSVKQGGSTHGRGTTTDNPDRRNQWQRYERPCYTCGKAGQGEGGMA